MKLEELGILPATIQLKVLWSLLLDGAQGEPDGERLTVAERLAAVQAPKPLRPPKYDLRIGRQGGVYQWASETSLEGLRFWHGVQKKRPSSNPKYAEADKRRLEDFERWINWREWEPYAPWQGERWIGEGKKTVQAAPPVPKPRVHENEKRKQQATGEANDDAAPSYTSEDEYDPLG